MASEIIMPRMTHDMKTGLLVKWLKREGEVIDIGTPLFEVETDKAISEVTADVSGILGKLLYQEGSNVPIGAVMAHILKEGETESDRPRHQASYDQLTLSAQQEAVYREVPPGKPVETDTDLPEIVASPIARKISRENKIDLSLIQGSGPRGRIIESDVRTFLANKKTNVRLVRDTEAPFEKIYFTKVQETSASRVTLSHQQIPMFVLEEDVDMSEVVHWHNMFPTQNLPAPSYTALLIKVVSQVLTAHPNINATFDGDGYKCFKEIHIGLATATSEGLKVFVVHQANLLNIPDIQSLLDKIHREVELGKMSPEFLGKSTFTISNLGMYGISRFKALINPPEAAILAVGAIKERPWRLSSGELGIAPILTLNLSVDHRVLDGSDAARFLAEVVVKLENPLFLI